MSNLTTVSLVIPVRNEISAILPCLESIFAQDYKGFIERLVVDGFSEDGTQELLEKLSKKNFSFVLLHNPKHSQTTSLNLAIRRAQGEVIIRLDAHATYSPDYITQCVAALEHTNAACVGGGVNLLKGTGYWANLFGMVQEHPFGTGVARFRRTSYEGFVDTVWPGAYRREVFEKVGLFREQLTRTEDLDFHARLRKQGYQIWQTPRIQPFYRPRVTWKELAQQYFGNGEQVIETILINRQAIGLRHLVPLLWITLFTILSVLALLVPLMRIPFYTYTGVYILACLISAWFIGLKHGLRYLWIAPFVFPLIHLSYGIGSWWGIWQIISHGFSYSSLNQSAPPTLE